MSDEAKKPNTESTPPTKPEAETKDDAFEILNVEDNTWFDDVHIDDSRSVLIAGGDDSSGWTVASSGDGSSGDGSSGDTGPKGF